MKRLLAGFLILVISGSLLQQDFAAENEISLDGQMAAAHAAAAASGLKLVEPVLVQKMPARRVSEKAQSHRILLFGSLLFLKAIIQAQPTKVVI